MTINNNFSLKQIAQETGFSIATISRVLNNKSNVLPETKQIVLEKLREYGYAFNKNQNVDSSTTIAIFIPDYSNPFYSEVLSGIDACAKIHQLKIIQILVPANGDQDFQYFKTLLSDINTKGIITLSPIKNTEVVRQLNQQIPLVMCSNHTSDSEISTVTIDDIEAAYQATKFLIQSGKKALLHVNSIHTHSYAYLRHEGFVKACNEHNIPYEELKLTSINYSLAYSQLHNFFMKKGKKIDGVFASSDIYAAAATQAAKSIGFKVPGDISIIGFDDISISTIISPSLTTIHQPRFDIGFQACEVLIEQIMTQYTEPKHVVLPTHIVIRESN